jgi:hypothetical protein
MKRLLLGISLLGLAAVLGGCPIYPSQQEYPECNSTACYSCPDPQLSSACTPWPCQSDSDCPGDGQYVCDPGTSTCLIGTGGDDGGTSEGGSGGDCSVNGCPSGQVCKLANGLPPTCVPFGSGDDASSDDSSAPADSGVTPPADASTPSDAAPEAGPVTGPCNSDATCGGHGEKCIDGQCTPQLDLCSDGSQCAAAGSACVDGVCEARCSSTSPCPTGYSCDLTRNVCNVNLAACSGSGTSSCQGGTTCVDGYCVPPCAPGDAGGICPTGQVCANGGCIPDQAATFDCTNDGQSGALANTCSSGQICLHHDCYDACGGDGGATCAAASATVCKDVTIETGSYSVCGTTNTLGSACDPAQGNYCSGGKVCVDGYCL